jgi:large conductance mechanosensitive channel
MFLLVKAYNKTKTPPAPPAPSGPSQEELLTQIRDLLKK